jgi:hypothetical protein
MIERMPSAVADLAIDRRPNSGANPPTLVEHARIAEVRIRADDVALADELPDQRQLGGDKRRSHLQDDVARLLLSMCWHETFASGRPLPQPKRLPAANCSGSLPSPAFATIPPESSPRAFPIEGDKPAMVDHLARRESRDIHMSTVPHPVMDAAALQARLVGLPVHQELRPADVDRIADAVLAAPLA